MAALFLNQNIKNFLANQISQKNLLSQSWLFYGEEHLGKFTTAYEFIKTLACDKKSWGGCGICHNCQAILNKWHPDIMIFETNEKFIKIENVTKIKEFLSYKPQLSSNRFVIINEAEKLTNDAESALLKILEEPPLNSIIILISSQYKKLLPTILSRLLKIRFSKEPKASLKTFLKQQYHLSDEEALFYVILSDNKIGASVNFIQNKSLFENKIYNIQLLGEIFHNKFSEVSQIIQNITANNENEETAYESQTKLIKDWLYFLHQLMLFNLQIEEKEKIATLWNKYFNFDISVFSRQQAKFLKNTLNLLNYATDYNLNKKLMFEAYYLTLA